MSRTQFADDDGRRLAHRGDLAGLARAYSRERRLEEALGCLDTAIGGSSATDRPEPDDDLWWTARRPVDYGGKPRTRAPAAPPRLDSPWTEERILVERARLLRRLGRFAAAAEAWEALAAGIGPIAVVAWVEVAKLREHRLGDLAGAFAAAGRARDLADRRRRMGRIDPPLDRAIAIRLGRLMRRLDVSRSRRSGSADRA